MKRLFLQLSGLLAVLTCLAMNFRPPGPAERLQAIGSTTELSATLQRALDPGDDFDQIPVPKAGDWLAEHPEAAQTFEDFVRSKRSKPDGQRNKIYLQPLGDFPKGRSPSVETLKQYTAAYFAMDVGVLSPVATSEYKLTTRINPLTENRQILTSDVLTLLKTKLPTDAFCALAITMEDLYPDPSWNFVFGQASLHERVGVFSFARYDPAFYGEKRGEDYQKVLLRRSCKVLVHEMAHMFSLAHCIFFKCVLNGSNHLQESDSRPLWLCPVCLRKLQFSIGFDVADRYGSLLRVYRKIDFNHEARWVAKRLKRISADENGKRLSKQRDEKA
jgi:archaemetzincin